MIQCPITHVLYITFKKHNFYVYVGNAVKTDKLKLEYRSWFIYVLEIHMCKNSSREIPLIVHKIVRNKALLKPLTPSIICTCKNRL